MTVSDILRVFKALDQWEVKKIDVLISAPGSEHRTPKTPVVS